MKSKRSSALSTPQHAASGASALDATESNAARGEALDTEEEEELPPYLAAAERSAHAGAASPPPSGPPAWAADDEDDFPYQSEMEQLFGMSFAGLDVSLGDGQPAGDGANATYDGRAVRFAEAQPSRETVAHELAHVAQAGGPASTEAVESTEHPAELEAEAVAKRAAAGQPVSVSQRRGQGVHREATPEAAAKEAGGEQGEEGRYDFAHGHIDLGETAEPIEIAFHPRVEHDGEIVQAAANLDFGIRLTPVVSDELEPGMIYVDTKIWAGVGGGVHVGSEAEFKQKAVPIDKESNLRDESTAAVAAGVGAEAEVGAALNLRKAHSAASFEQVREALKSIEPAIRSVLQLYEQGVALAGEVEGHITALKQGAEDLDEALHKALGVVETGASIGEWAAEVALLGETFGNILIAAHEIGEGAVDVVGVLMGNPALAHELETGECFDIRTAAEASAYMNASVDGSVALHQGKGGMPMLNPDGTTGKANFSAGFSREGKTEWDRTFSVDGMDLPSGKGVAVKVRFAQRSESSEDLRGSVGVHSLQHDEAESSSEGHKLEVHLPREHPRFDELYGKVFKAMTPEQLIALTYDKALHYDGSAGIISLAMDRSWMGEQSTSTFLGDGESEGLIGGGTVGEAESHVVIDYRDKELDEASVQAGGESGAQLNWADNALSRTIGEEMDELFGVNPLAGQSPLEFWKSRNSFSYDGELATFTSKSDTLVGALANIDIAMGKAQIEKLAVRAADAKNWSAAASWHVLNLDSWEALGKNLVAASRAKNEASLPVPGGIPNPTPKLAVLVDGPDGKPTQPMIGSQPWIPPEAARDWRVFLMADLLGNWIAEANRDPLIGSDGVIQLFNRARDMDFEDSSGMREVNADYSEIGVEVEEFDAFEHSDGTRIGEHDLFQHVEDRSLDLTRDLRDAAQVAEAEIARQFALQAKTHTAMEVSPDEAVMRPARAQLEELRHLLGQVRAQDASEFANRDAAASTLRFVTDLHTKLAGALADYQRVFGKHWETAGYAVSLDGEGHDFRTQHVVEEDSGARETDSFAAGELALSMYRMIDIAGRQVFAFLGTDPSDLEKSAGLHKEYADAMKRWHTMNADFGRIFSRYPKTQPLRPPEHVDPEVWREAIHHERRDEVVALGKAHDTGWSQDGAYETALPIHEGADVIEEEVPEPRAPEARPELFTFGRPYPKALLGAQVDDPEVMRRKHQALGPEDLKTIGSDRGDWGFTGDSVDYVLEMGARIAHALSTGAAGGSTWTIVGHTDDVDTSLYNAYLGYRRAMAVRNLLVEAGVPPAVLAVQSRGETQLTALYEDDTVDSYRERRRRVVLGEEDESSGEDSATPSTAVDALYGAGQHSANLANTVETDTSEEGQARFANREGQRTDTAQTLLEMERAEVADKERYAALVREHYGDLPSALTLFTTVYALAHNDAEAEAILARRGRWRVKAFQAACRAQGLDETLPHNEDAVGDLAARSIEFQPATMDRTGRYTLDVHADIWKLGGLEVGFFKGGEEEILAAAASRLEQLGGPSLALVDVKGNGGRVTPDSWRIDGGGVTLSFIAASPAAEQILDELSRSIGAWVAPDEGGQGVEQLGVGAGGPSDGDRLQRAYRALPLLWSATAEGELRLITPRLAVPDVPEELAAVVWQRHVEEHLAALEPEVGIGAVAHAFPLGPLVTDLVARDAGLFTGSFLPEEAFEMWMDAQGREIREDEVHEIEFGDFEHRFDKEQGHTRRRSELKAAFLAALAGMPHASKL